MISLFRRYAMMIVPMALFAFTLDTSRATGEPVEGSALNRLPLAVKPVDGYPGRPLPASAKWGGREYDIDRGIELLMSVVRDPEKGTDKRQFALLRLSMLDRHLRGRKCLDDLAKLYDDPGGMGKDGILLCFEASDDPRGIPLFIRVIDEEQNIKLRLSAAAGLAQWNVRRGVAELVHLLDSQATFRSTSLTVNVRDKALELFRIKNRIKGWGFPENLFWKSIDARVDLDEDRKRTLYNARIEKDIKAIKTWFAQNEDRFPDWKLGDPLPEDTRDASEDFGGK